VGQYVLQRIALLLPVLIGVSLIVFFILRVVPGDVARRYSVRGGPVVPLTL